MANPIAKVYADYFFEKMGVDRGNSISKTEWGADIDELLEEGEISSVDADYWRTWFNDVNLLDEEDTDEINYDDLYKHLVVLENAGELKEEGNDNQHAKTSADWFFLMMDKDKDNSITVIEWEAGI